MRIGFVVLAVAKSQVFNLGEGWNICPSNSEIPSPESGINDNGCYKQTAQWVDGKSKVECNMTNKNCIKVDCSDSTRIKAWFRADLFHHNDVYDGDFIEQLQAGEALLRHRTNAGDDGHNEEIPFEDADESCGYTINNGMIHIDWDYDECEDYIMARYQSKSRYYSKVRYFLLKTFYIVYGPYCF